MLGGITQEEQMSCSAPFGFAEELLNSGDRIIETEGAAVDFFVVWRVAIHLPITCYGPKLRLVHHTLG